MSCKVRGSCPGSATVPEQGRKEHREHQNCGGYSGKGPVRRMTDKAFFREGNSYCLIT